MQNLLFLLILAIATFVQNMTFTMVSRSRCSADTAYHRKCSWLSNGTWFLCNILVMRQVWDALENGNWVWLGLAFIVYSMSTAEGSVFMMKRMLRSETGLRKVGATINREK